MTRSPRLFVRRLALALVAASLAACHFHGHHCGGQHFHMPVRHCR